jgi:hypothetical protein
MLLKHCLRNPFGWIRQKCSGDLLGKTVIFLTKLGRDLSLLILGRIISEIAILES